MAISDKRLFWTEIVWNWTCRYQTVFYVGRDFWDSRLRLPVTTSQGQFILSSRDYYWTKIACWTNIGSSRSDNFELDGKNDLKRGNRNNTGNRWGKKHFEWGDLTFLCLISSRIVIGKYIFAVVILDIFWSNVPKTLLVQCYKNCIWIHFLKKFENKSEL